MKRLDHSKILQYKFRRQYWISCFKSLLGNSWSVNRVNLIWHRQHSGHYALDIQYIGCQSYNSIILLSSMLILIKNYAIGTWFCSRSFHNDPAMFRSIRTIISTQKVMTRQDMKITNHMPCRVVVNFNQPINMCFLKPEAGDPHLFI